MVNWPLEIVAMSALHQEEAVASAGVIEPRPFGPKATTEAIDQCEVAIGCRFDPQHREFMLHANGWDGFSGTIDLFSTADFLGSARFKTAQDRMKQMDRRVLGTYAKQRTLLLPIGKSSASTDLLLMLKGGDQVRPKVLWFTNELVEEFESFEQMFVSFKVYVQSGIEYWRKRNSKGR